MNRAREHRMDAVISEQADRIEDLEKLVADMWAGMCSYEHDCSVCDRYDGLHCEFVKRILEIGIEVDE